MCERYIHVGEKFERLMDMEEKENGETIRQLNNKFRLMKEQKDKMKKRADKIIADLEVLLRAWLTARYRPKDRLIDVRMPFRAPFQLL